MIKIFLITTLILTQFKAMTQELKKVSYTEGKTTHQGEAIVVNTNGAAVLILPAWMGIDDEARAAAKDLANEGYNVLIADIYGVENTPQNTTEAKIISSYYKAHPNEYRVKIQTALNELTKLGARKDKIAIIGYCFGGTGALEAARANMPFTGVVSIHGGLKKVDNQYNTIKPKVLVIHPSEDESVPLEDVDLFMDEMRKGAADWQFFYYSNSKHTFTNPKSKDYNSLMTKRAWNHVKMFLKEILE